MASTITKFFKSTTKFIEDHNNDIVKKLREVLSLDDEQYNKMVEALKVDEITDLKKLGKKCGTAKTRAPTAYNLYVQSKIKELKLAEPDIDRKQLMIKAAASWTAAKKQKSEEASEVAPSVQAESKVEDETKVDSGLTKSKKSKNKNN
jgi:negative regulator of replication initiation